MNRTRKILSTFSLWRRAWSDRRGVAAVEFALIAPVAIAAIVGEFTISESYTINRKVTIAARTITDLIARQTKCVNPSDVTKFLNAVTQIAAPYPVSNMAVTVAELTTDANNNTTVAWSEANANATALTAGASFTPASGVTQTGGAVIYGYVQYTYTPIITYVLPRPITISNTFYMYPRNSANVTESSTCTVLY
jgi:Flp pilus assembly protein TadG